MNKRNYIYAIIFLLISTIVSASHVDIDDDPMLGEPSAKNL